jgi:subtilase family serine protease
MCFTGWGVVGGTSASAPIVAGVYGLAGNGSTVNYGSFPYSHTTSLFDVTAGNNGSCSPAYLCTSGAGYDGPTGLGAPNGTAAF